MTSTTPAGRSNSICYCSSISVGASRGDSDAGPCPVAQTGGPLEAVSEDKYSHSEALGTTLSDPSPGR